MKFNKSKMLAALMWCVIYLLVAIGGSYLTGITIDWKTLIIIVAGLVLVTIFYSYLK
ncbi:hypothetical protein ACYATO_09160 [Lactobacillaceae bacterium Melli_B3]